MLSTNGCKGHSSISVCHRPNNCFSFWLILYRHFLSSIKTTFGTYLLKLIHDFSLVYPDGMEIS